MRVLLDQPPGQRWRDHGIARGHRTDPGEKLGRQRVLDQTASPSWNFVSGGLSQLEPDAQFRCYNFLDT
jgi:hypothetical protein